MDPHSLNCLIVTFVCKWMAAQGCPRRISWDKNEYPILLSNYLKRFCEGLKRQISRWMCSLFLSTVQSCIGLESHLLICQRYLPVQLCYGAVVKIYEPVGKCCHCFSWLAVQLTRLERAWRIVCLCLHTGNSLARGIMFSGCPYISAFVCMYDSCPPKCQKHSHGLKENWFDIGPKAKSPVQCELLFVHPILVNAMSKEHISQEQQHRTHINNWLKCPLRLDGLGFESGQTWMQHHWFVEADKCDVILITH